MLHYSEEVIKVEGKVYTPTTDVIHEVEEGVYTNVLINPQGKKYEAYYNQEHYDNNDWSNPFRIVELL